MQKNGPLALAFNALVITFMLAPLLVVCIVAFTPHNTLTLPTTEFSLRWFKAVFAHSDFVQSFWNSLWLALASATLATVLAVPAGIAITRYEFAGRGFLNGLFLSPLIIPHLVLGVALLRLFALLGGTGSFGWLVFAHALIVTPYTLRLVVAALVGGGAVVGWQRWRLRRRPAARASENRDVNLDIGQSVAQFSASNDKLMDTLQRIEGTLQQSMARSDEQLAYYVAQAREVIDLSVLSQKQIIGELKHLADQRAALGTEAA